MKRLISSSFATVVFIALLTTNVCALQYQVDFMASDFSNVTGSTPSPYSLIVGSFGFEAASPTSPVDSLTSVNLEIGGYDYGLGDIDFINDLTNERTHIGGIITGVTGLAAGNDDFDFVWSYADPSRRRFFIYGTSSVPGNLWNTSWVENSNNTPVPEPSTFLLLGGGLAGLAFYARRRRKE